jgi:hypothetical protein
MATVEVGLSNASNADHILQPSTETKGALFTLLYANIRDVLSAIETHDFFRPHCVLRMPSELHSKLNEAFSALLES